jgi:anti-sigma B factor antagonist
MSALPMIAARSEGAVEDRDEREKPVSVDARGIRPPAAYSIANGDGPAGVSVVVLRGELDLAAAPVLRARVDEATAGRALVIDLADTTFIDSAVLKELLRARAELAAHDVRLVLAAVPPPVRRLLDLTRTSELFDDVPDAATALRQLSV